MRIARSMSTSSISMFVRPTTPSYTRECKRAHEPLPVCRPKTSAAPQRRSAAVRSCTPLIVEIGAVFGNARDAGERLLQLAPALDRYHDGAHPVALREHELLDLAFLELGEQRAEVAHRLADGAQLVGAD